MVNNNNVCVCVCVCVSESVLVNVRGIKFVFVRESDRQISINRHICGEVAGTQSMAGCCPKEKPP